MQTRPLIVLLALASAACGGDEPSGRGGSGGSDAGSSGASGGGAGAGGGSGGSAIGDGGADIDAGASAGCPLLIKYGLDIPTASFVASNAATIDTMPFDGLVLSLPGHSAAIQRPTPVNGADIAAALAPLAGKSFAKVRHNFVRVLATNGGSFDDYAIPADNFAALATAAKDAGLEGIFFDNEEYFPEYGPVWGSSACTSGDLPQCQAAARAAGKLVMSKMIAAWPSVSVIVVYGPWVSDSKTFDYFEGHFPYNDVAWANPMMGPFVVGMIEATAGSSARLVDGGEIYALRDTADFERAYQWMKTELPKQSTLIPPSLAGAYASSVSIAFGVYDRAFRGAPMSVALFESSLANALGAADHYVWPYTEEHDWWGVGWPTGGPPPEAWVDAVESARQAVPCRGN